LAFPEKDAKDKHYVNVGRVATVLLFLASIADVATAAGREA
jgi:hypothetical protein